MLARAIGNIQVLFQRGTAKIFQNEDGVGVVEVILILLVLVGLVIIFKDQIVALAKSIFSNISNQVNTI
ncbi:MAG: hypothetical protein IKZ95_02640 [Lachnospiraceae bacterium]|nr:hypothetical protein [Lachnospiraceae bacterium]